MKQQVAEVHEDGVEVVREVVVELEVQVLHVDEDVIVLEIVEVREDVIEIVEVLMMQLHQEVFVVMCKSEFAAFRQNRKHEGRVNSHVVVQSLWV